MRASLRDWAASPALGLLLLGIVVFCAQCLFFTTYGSDDDVTVKLIVEGRLMPGSVPAPDAFFINLALGHLMAAAFRLRPNISWYDFYQQAVLAGAFFIVIRMIQVLVSVQMRMVVILFTLTCFLALFVTPQFTAAGIIGVGFGLAAIVLPLIRGFSSLGRREAFLFPILGFAVALGGALLRLESALLAGIVLACLLLILLPLLPPCTKARGAWFRVLLILALCILSIALFWTAHLHFYVVSLEWSRFRVLNLYRAELAEYAATTWRSADSHNSGGAPLSPADMNALKNWAFFDPAVFSLSHLRAAAQGYWRAKLRLPSVFLSLNFVLRSLASVTSFFFGVIGLLLLHSNGRFTCRMLLTGGMLLGIGLVIAVAAKPLPWRALWPVGILVFMILAICPEQGARNAARVWGGALLLVRRY